MRMKYLLLVFICMLVWQCGVCKNAKGSYKVVEKDAKVSKYDKHFVKKTYFTGGFYDLNSEGITEHYYETLSIYMDSVNYGKKWPQNVDAYLYRNSVEEILDSSNVEIRNTVLGVGIFINRRFKGDETHLKLVLTLDEEPPRKLVLDFDLLQKSNIAWHSRCMDAFLRL